MNIVNGNLIEMALKGEIDVIVHGCNCFNTMGAGFARQIRQAFPSAYEQDRRYTVKGDRNKLGMYSQADDDGVIIVNGYTQYAYGLNESTRYVDYDAVRSVFKRVKEEFGNLRIGYPKIGVGLANGDWEVIKAIIDEELEGCDHTLVIYDTNK